MASATGNLDHLIIEKVKQHNKSLKGKRIQEAIALREKLEKWKEEKAKKLIIGKKTNKCSQESKQRTASFPPKLKPTRVSLQNAKTSGIYKHLSSGKVFNKRPTGQQFKASSTGNMAQRSRSSLPQPQPQKVTSSVSTKPPVSRRSVGGPKKGIGKIQKILQTEINIKAPTINSLKVIAKEKENAQMKDATTEQHPKIGELGAAVSTLPAPVLSTPLSHNNRISMRQVIASLASKSGEKGTFGAQSQTVPLVAVHSLPGTGESDQPMNQTFLSQEIQEGEADNAADKTFSVEQSDNTQPKQGGTSAAERKARRDSLSAQFRIQKNQSAITAGKSHSYTSVMRKSFRGKPAGIRSEVQKPRRSILKRKSCDPQSAVATSPFLFSVRASVSDHDQSSEARERSATALAPAPADSEKHSGHVTFAVESHHSGDGVNFRKTPAIPREGKTQESLRAKLNEWRASKKHTPNVRHANCFHTEGHSTGKPTPCSQVKPSITVEQLSKQENALVQEELKKNLLTHFNAVPSPRSTVSVRQTPKHLPSSCDTRVAEQNASSSEMDISWEHDAATHENSKGPKTGGGEEGMEVGEEEKSAAPQFDRESWDISRLDQDLEMCLAAIESGSLSTGAALDWLDSMHEAFADVKVCIGWYRCRVAAHKADRDSDAVLAVFEQAIVNNVQPAEEMAKLLTQTMKDVLTWPKMSRKGRKSAASATRVAWSEGRKRRSSQHLAQQQVQTENMFESTTVKYSVVEVTPFKKRRRVTEAGTNIRPVITPVRRSARLSVARATSLSEGRSKGPASITEYTDLSDVPSTEKEKMLFQPNKALDTLLSEASPDVETSGNQQ